MHSCQSYKVPPALVHYLVTFSDHNIRFSCKSGEVKRMGHEFKKIKTERQLRKKSVESSNDFRKIKLANL